MLVVGYSDRRHVRSEAAGRGRQRHMLAPTSSTALSDRSPWRAAGGPGEWLPFRLFRVHLRLRAELRTVFTFL